MLKPRVAVLLLAVGGTLVGHVLGYFLAAAGGLHRHVDGASHVHGYLTSAAIGVVPLAVVAFGWLVLSGARRLARRSDADIRLGSLVGLQLTFYLLQEVLERVPRGIDVSGLVGDSAVWMGLGAQLAVAAVLVAAVWWTRRVVATALRLLPLPRTFESILAGFVVVPASWAPRPQRLLIGAVSRRGPPSPSVC